MTKKYRSKQVKKRQNSNQAIQTVVLIIVVIGMIGGIISYSIPALTKFALLLGEIKDTSNPISNTDTIPPTAPILNSIPHATSSGNIYISGYTEPAATVDLYHNNIKVQDTLANSSGGFEFINIKLEKGKNSFYAISHDSAHNTSDPSPIKSTTYDTEPPELTITSPEDGQVFYGLKERTITITGKTENDTSVKLNDRFILVSDDGSFSTQLQLEEGDNSITLEAKDKAGNKSATTIHVTYKP